MRFSKPLATITALALLGSSAATLAVDFDRIAPKKGDDSKATKIGSKAAPAAKDAGAEDPRAPRLSGLRIVASREQVKTAGNVAVEGVGVGKDASLDILRGPDFEYLMSGFIGLRVSEALLSNVQREIILYYRGRNRPVVDVVIPAQESIGSGVLQVYVVEGKLGKIVVEGNNWTKEKRIQKNVRLEEGGTIDTGAILSGVDWLNTNPGRTISPSLRPGAALGTSDLVLNVNEKKIPFDFYVGVDNTGPELIGSERMFAGINWNNAFGLDHRVGYRYTMATDIRNLMAHSLSYDIPLPWKHTLSFYGGYVEAESDFGNGNGAAVQTSDSWQTSMRYNILLPKIGDYNHDFSLGFDYKRFDSDLIFNGVFAVFNPLTTRNDVSIAQIVANYRSNLPDKWGGTSFSVEGFFSPGGFGDYNDDVAFGGQETGASANYMYARANLTRIVRLPANLSGRLNGLLQISEGDLQGSEKFGVGGAATVRGYEERQANGDDAYVLNAEIYSPTFSVAKYLDPEAVDSIQFLTFFDYGVASPHARHLPGEDKHQILSSFGVGMRYSIKEYFNLKFDYGWQLPLADTTIPRRHQSRAHLSAILSF